MVWSGDCLHIPTIVMGEPGHPKMYVGPFHLSVTMTKDATSKDLRRSSSGHSRKGRTQMGSATPQLPLLN